MPIAPAGLSRTIRFVAVPLNISYMGARGDAENHEVGLDLRDRLGQRFRWFSNLHADLG